MVKAFGYQYKPDHSVTIFAGGKLVTIEKDAINYSIVMDALKKHDWQAVEDNLNVRQAIADHTDGRVEIFGDEIWLDKKPIHPSLSSRIIPMFKNGFNVTPLFRFLENVQANPEQYSRDELYLFLEKNNLPITPDGHFLAYKMIRGNYTDCYSGSISNNIGDKPSMERSLVDPDRNNTCSRGLHFCSYSYLNFAYTLSGSQRLMVVKINPADVVSIPNDFNNAKGRCWTYEVVDELPHHDDKLNNGYTEEYEKEYDEESEEEEESEEWEESFSWEEEEESEEEDESEEDDAEDAPELNNGSKLDAADVRELRIMLKDGWTLRAIADTFVISPRQVARIRDGENWANVK